MLGQQIWRAPAQLGDDTGEAAEARGGGVGKVEPANVHSKRKHQPVAHAPRLDELGKRRQRIRRVRVAPSLLRYGHERVPDRRMRHRALVVVVTQVQVHLEQLQPEPPRGM